ncbi:MAG: TfoX/Sxy family DNA transformation protein, partial [Pseudomonadota bacterium]
MRLGFEPVGHLKNIGPTIARNLARIGIRTRSDLAQATAVGAYLHLSASFPDERWPVCYYLYSLEGALRDKHWDKLSAG